MLGDKKYSYRDFLKKFYNKYFLVGLIFLVWLVFLDEQSFIVQRQLKRKITALEKQKDYYKEKSEEDKRKIDELTNNKETLEKFAREQYLMKNKNEDIFIIVDE
ncbi:MAG: septum formation initiator family protein [Culturomica sp.]|jgi:cell division protein FtsB|nr:septum formation initiator family protein [Culturomica sp.]